MKVESRAQDVRPSLVADPDGKQQTFPQMLAAWARTSPAAVGLREQHHGIWREWTWLQIWETCASLGEGLLASGLEPGDRVAFMGDPCIEGLLMTLAAQGIGAVPYGIFPTTPPEGVRYMIEDAAPVCFIGEDQEFVDKAMVGGLPPDLKLLAVADPKGMFGEEYRDVVPWGQLQARGNARLEAQPDDWEQRVRAGRVTDICGIYYTSGTTGQPKGALLTHRNVLSGFFAPFGDGGGRLPTPTSRDRSLHDIPVASFAGPLFGIYFPLVYGLVGHVPDKTESAAAAFTEVAPTLYLGFPRMWEMLAARALVAVETSSWLHRRVFAVGMAMRRAAVGPHRLPLMRLVGALGYVLVVRPMLDQWGLLCSRYIFSGGAPVSPDLVKLWRLWGVTIRELYGMTECGGLATLQVEDDPEPGVAGPAVPGVDLRIAEDGEILVRGANVFSGYWKREEQTRAALETDGWLHTGDIGTLREDGNLIVIDRKRDVLVLNTSLEVPSSSIEHVLKYSPYIRDALLVGEGRPFLTALLEIDLEFVSQWARKHKVSYTGFTDLATNAQVVGLLEAEVEKANRILEERGSATVDHVRVLPKELDPEDPTEITATRKIRRRELAKKFDDLVADMYRTEESVRVAQYARGAYPGSTGAA